MSRENRMFTFYDHQQNFKRLLSYLKSIRRNNEALFQEGVSKLNRLHAKAMGDADDGHLDRDLATEFVDGLIDKYKSRIAESRYRSRLAAGHYAGM